jgi:hypothetical protein
MLILFFTIRANAQPWIGTAPGNIYYNQGNVSIGTNNPEKALDIFGVARTINKDTQGATWDNLSFWTEGERSYIQSNGDENGLFIKSNLGNKIILESNVGIRTSAPQNALDVNGTIRAKEVKVETGWADFVFDKAYNLQNLSEVELLINEHKHLPDIPDAKDVKKNGVNLGEMNVLLLKKIKELTLYAIKQNKKVEELTLYTIDQNKSLQDQSKKIESLEKAINILISK